MHYTQIVLFWFCVALAKYNRIGKMYATIVQILPDLTAQQDLNCVVSSGFGWSLTMKFNQFSGSNLLVTEGENQFHKYYQ